MPQAVHGAARTAATPCPSSASRSSSGGRRSAARPTSRSDGDRPSFRLGDVYAEELARLREQAHAEGFAAGYAEGLAAAEQVVAEAERAAAERLAEVQARWERRLASATAALGAAVRTAGRGRRAGGRRGPRDSVLGSGHSRWWRTCSAASWRSPTDPGLDAVRRALTLCPADAPVVVRLHPDDLAEIPAEALAELPDTVRVVGDPRVERAGAVAETGSQRIDAQLGAALERVQAVLRL